MPARGALYSDLTGLAFGRWTVRRFAGRRHRRSLWECICDCGTPGIVSDSNLKSGKSRSCGCLKREIRINRSVRSGRQSASGVRSPEYHSWSSMIARATAKNDDRRGLDYALRGITVCARWRSFDNFLADMGKRPAGTSLERKDNNRGYSKSNCKWATASEQVRNRRSSDQVAEDRAAAKRSLKRKAS